MNKKTLKKIHLRGFVKKTFAVVALLTIFSIYVSKNVYALETIYEKTYSERISSGVVLKNYTRFVDKGWLDIYVAEVDLTDKNTRVGLLNSENGLNTFQTVYQMANASTENVVAAVNGDFFNGTYKNGNTIGLSISEGEILTSTYYENEVKDTFGTFALDEDNNGIFGYFSNKISLAAKGSEVVLSVAEINKVSSDYSYPVLYTSKWGEKSLGAREDFVITEMLVDNGKVVEVRTNGEAFDIPENGFVISTCGNAAAYMAENFKKGTKVELQVEMELDYEKIDFAVSGGAMLVENGQIPEKFASNISGTNPRTAIGLSKNGKTLYLVTVDGRQKKSIGMTQTELAEFLIEKGIYQALNLDGGGSTTMVARELGEEGLKTVNSPSGGSLRMVTNAVGVYNTNKTSSLSELVLKVSEENVFAGCKREIEVLGYDKYYNPVSVDMSKVKWSYSGVPVTVRGNQIVAGEEAGTATVTAKVGKATASVSVDVLSSPSEISISPKTAAVQLGESVSYLLKVKNKNGYSASVNSDEITFRVVSGKGSFEGDKFTPKAEGDCLISVSAGNAVAYAKVTVGKAETVTLENFETESYQFVSYPEEVLGSASRSSKEKYEGKYSAKLEYDFTETDATRAAYVRFQNEGIVLPENADRVSFKVYSPEAKEDYIKLKLVDAKGVTSLVMVRKGIPGGEWTELTYDLNKVALPATLTDIYVAQDNADIKNTGTVYFDDLTIVKDSDVKVSGGSIPDDVKGEDSANKESDLSAEESLKILVYDHIPQAEILLDRFVESKLKQKMSEEAEVAIITGTVTESEGIATLADTNQNLILAAGTSYTKRNAENATFITLDVSKGGLRSTDYHQWNDLQSDIKSSRQKNVFVVMNGSLASFSDGLERDLFVDVLCDLRRTTAKNIWVICQGEKTTYAMERGIKYLSVGNEWISPEEPMERVQNTKYMVITVGDNELSYEIKNLFGES